MKAKACFIKLLVLILAISLILGLTPTMGNDWAIKYLEYRVKLRVRVRDLNFSINSILVPVRVNNTIIDFNKTSPVGDDIVVTDVHGNILPASVEYWNTSTGKGLIWVKTPLEKGSATIYVYYGLTSTYRGPINTSSPWSDYRLVLLFSKSSLDYIHNIPFLRNEVTGRTTARIYGRGFSFVESLTGQAMYFDGKNAWCYVANISFYNWSFIAIEALLYIHREQSTYGIHRDLSYGRRLTTPFTAFYILYTFNKTNPNVTLYFDTWRVGKAEATHYKVDLSRYKGQWVYLVITYNRSTREYIVYVNGDKVYDTVIPRDELTVFDIRPTAYGSSYRSIGIAADNTGFERTRVTYDFLMISENRAVNEQYVKAEYRALMNTSVEFLGAGENPNTGNHIVMLFIPKSLIAGLALLLIAVTIYYVYNRYRRN